MKNILLSLLWLVFLSGCATTQNDYKVQVLENRIFLLENQVSDLSAALESEEEKNQELRGIIEEQNNTIEELTQGLEKEKREKQVLPKSKDKAYYSFVIIIQTALKNAGFDPGLIDGKMGRRTRIALQEFQRANNLPADGRVDKQTWILLRNYL